MNKRSTVIGGAALIVFTSLAFAQAPPMTASPNAPMSNSQSSGSARPKAISQDEVRRTLQQAGFENIEFLESAYVVRATNANGTKMIMTITPEEIRAVEVAPSNPSGNVGQPGMPGRANSGAVIPGQAGNKNGPGVNLSGTAANDEKREQNEAAKTQDSSGIPGKPGGKSGPSVMPPSGAPK
jgi:hypothetical protein